MSKNIILYEKGTNNETYPKTVISQVEGLSTALEEAGVSTSVVLNEYDFGSAVPLTAGTYIVKNPINSPFGGEDGILKVISTGPNSTIHTWSGKKYTAYREYGTFNPLEANVEAVTINGVAVNTAVSDSYTVIGGVTANRVKFTYEQKDTVNFNSGKIMWLYPGGTYTLSGVLIDCQIRIGYLESWCKDNTTEFQSKKFDAAEDNCATTTIILNNFYHKVNCNMAFDASDEDSWTAAIEVWGPLIMSEIAGKENRRGKLVIRLADNTKNYLVRELGPTVETANNKWGVIYSEQDLDIEGTGYLGIADGQDNGHLLGCHAVKAKGFLKIHGQPHIVGRAYHDLLHGNDGLYIDGGYFQQLYGNDTLGTDTSLGDQAIGKIRLYNGVFDVRECFGTFCQADDVIVYPDVKISFKKIGEGLWLQCAPGFFKGEITKKGQVSNFSIVDYTNHTFSLYTPTGVKLDAAAFERYIEDVQSVTVYVEKTYKNAGKFADAISEGGNKTPYILVNGEYVACETGHTYDPENEVYYTMGSGSGVKIFYDGQEKDVPASKVVTSMPGIIVYNGVTVTPDEEYNYAESNRNTHVETLTNSGLEPIGGWNFNLTFNFTSAETEIANELTLAEAAALIENGSENNIGAADFEAIDFRYSGSVTGGVWNIGLTEQGLMEYKNDVDYLLTCVKGMLVPPKEVGILDVVTANYNIETGLYTTEDVENLRNDELVNSSGAEIAAGAAEDNYGHTNSGKIKDEASIYTSKTGLEPTIKLEVGEAVFVKGFLSPDNTTNYAMKWSVVGESEWTTVGRLVSDDTMGCYVRGLQPGKESIVVSAKALNKDNGKVKLKVHFFVPDNFSITAGLIPSPTDSELVTTASAISSVEFENDTITITGDLSNIVSYLSSDPDQNSEPHKWIGLEINTGEDSLNGIRYGDYTFTAADISEATEVGCSAGSFVLYVKADEIVNTPKQFSLSKDGFNTKNISVSFVDSNSL